MGDTLGPGETLDPGEQLINGPYCLTMQYDGNLVLSFGATVLWSEPQPSGGAIPDSSLKMLVNGTLVLEAPLGGIVWYVQTQVQDCSLLLEGNGNVVILGPDGSLQWSTNTGNLTAIHSA